MKAVVYTRYGSPDVLQLKEVDKPVPGDDEVLIKLEAVSLNRSDWEGLVGRPLYARLGGLRQPRRQILGSDIAGRIEAVGKDHHQFHPGEAVYGDVLNHMGGFAEYVCARGGVMALKPAGLTFEAASTLPQAAIIAQQAIRDKAQLQPGQRVLINGAGGGTGMFAIQLAKAAGAQVTGVDNAGKLEFMRSVGADHVIDYARQDFTRSGQQYDFILDLVAYRSAFACARALKPKGRYYAVGGPVPTLLQIAFARPWIQRTTGKQVRVLVVRPNAKDLVRAAELVAAGTLVPKIDRRFPLSQVPAALRYLGEGRARGKVVITVAQGDQA
jgi:NADPH:quinone reductase-like Zn-dependent oxidoreductase